MVNFQCEGCGECVRKPKAEQHAWSCRAFSGFTCIDCLTRFTGDSFKTHNTCITEAAKYNHAYVPKVKPKPLSEKKGESVAVTTPKAAAKEDVAARDTAVPRKSKKRDQPDPAAESPAVAEPQPETPAATAEPKTKKARKEVPAEVVEYFKSRARRILNRNPEMRDSVDELKSAALQAASTACSSAVDALLAEMQ